MFGVASTPTLPLSVIAAAISACGSTTGTTSTPCSAATSRATSAPIEVAVLQAITSSLAESVAEQPLGDRADPLAQPLRVAGAVGEHRRVAEVDEVLLGQRDQALVEDGEPADPRVEHRDRWRGVGYRNGLYVMKKIVTTTTSPAKAPTLPIRSPDRFELVAERVARLQVALGELLCLAHLRFEEGVLQRQEERPGEEADADEGLVGLPVAVDQQVEGREDDRRACRGRPGTCRTSGPRSRIAGVARGYWGTTEKKSA